MLQKAEKIQNISNQVVSVLKMQKILASGEAFSVTFEGSSLAEIKISPSADTFASDFVRDLSVIMEKHRNNLSTKLVHEIRSLRID